ncbi:hypothetical protein RJ639_009110, partial [Escallonia herrerae]
SQQRRIDIRNKHGEKLAGILHETGSTEIVIICHGYRSSKDRIPMVNLAAAFKNEGISTFRFDFAGNGDSEGSFQYGNYRREADDLHAVVHYFFAEKLSVAAIVGHSKGGNVVLLYASRYDDVHTVVNVSGRFDLRRGIEGRLGKDFIGRIKLNGSIDIRNRRGKIEYRVTEECLMDRLTTDMCAACQSIQQNCRVLTIHGSMDEMVPVEDAMEFAKYISNHRLIVIQRADHEYTFHQDELASFVVDFVNKGSEHSLLSGRADEILRSRF